MRRALSLVLLFAGCGAGTTAAPAREPVAEPAEVPEPLPYRLVVSSDLMAAGGEWTGIVVGHDAAWTDGLERDYDEYDVTPEWVERCLAQAPAALGRDAVWDVLAPGDRATHRVSSCAPLTFGGAVAMVLSPATPSLALALPEGLAPDDWRMEGPDAFEPAPAEEAQAFADLLGAPLGESEGAYIDLVARSPGEPALFYADASDAEGSEVTVLARRDARGFRFLRVGSDGGALPGIPEELAEHDLGHHTFVVRALVQHGDTVEVLTEGTSVGESDVMLHRLRGGEVEQLVLMAYSDGG